MNAVPARIKDPLPAPTECPYCHAPVAYVNNRVIYGEPHGWPMAYLCTNGRCRARIGCHPGTNVPLGTLADLETRRARQLAHEALDPLWKLADNPMKQRTSVYRWLAGALGIPLSDCHVGMMSAETCRRVVDACLKRELKAHA